MDSEYPNCSVVEAVRRSLFSVAFLLVFFLTDMFFEIILDIYVYKVELHTQVVIYLL